MITSKQTEIYFVDGKEYLSARIVTLNNKEYQELHRVDIMSPDVVYLEQIGRNPSLVEDWNTYYALREKYAIDKRTLRGKIVLHNSCAMPTSHSKRKFLAEIKRIPCFKNVSLKFERDISKDGTRGLRCLIDSGEHKGHYIFYKGKDFGNYSPLFIEKANEQLVKLFEQDVKEFSENGAKAFGHILSKYGIDNPQKWLEGKMRRTYENSKLPPYIYLPELAFGSPAAYIGTCDCIGFSSFFSAKMSKFIRAHEMAHKTTSSFTRVALENETYEVGHCGLMTMGVSEKTDRKTGLKHYIGTEFARGFNEGATHLIAQKLSKKRGFPWIIPFYPVEYFSA